jgi:GNAT superfamily N-acetyltransferase
MFTAKAYRATRLVVMPEWQGTGVGMAFLKYVCQYHVDGNGRCGHKLPVFFHTSHPQLCMALRKAKGWVQTAAHFYGSNKVRSAASIIRTGKSKNFKSGNTGYGGHFRAIQAFKYAGDE